MKHKWKSLKNRFSANSSIFGSRISRLFDVYFQVVDPYRWLETPDSDETKTFIDAENEITQLFTKNCDEWQKINEKLTALFNYPKYALPRRHGQYYYTSMNTGLQNQ